MRLFWSGLADRVWTEWERLSETSRGKPGRVRGEESRTARRHPGSNMQIASLFPLIDIVKEFHKRHLQCLSAKDDFQHFSVRRHVRFHFSVHKSDQAYPTSLLISQISHKK